MIIVLDTSVLSHAWRRRRPNLAAVERLATLSQDDDVELIVPGIVLQELLAGTRTTEQAARLRRLMEALTLEVADVDLHVQAASIETTCARNGISAGAIDSLVAAHAIRRRGQLFTLDEDFRHIAAHAPLQILQMSEVG